MPHAVHVPNFAGVCFLLLFFIKFLKLSTVGLLHLKWTDYADNAVHCFIVHFQKPTICFYDDIPTQSRSTSVTWVPKMM